MYHTRRGGILDGEFWVRALVCKGQRVSKGTILRTERTMRTEPLVSVFLLFEEVLSKDFEEGCKVARINFFAVYLLSVRTRQEVGKKMTKTNLRPRDKLSAVEAAFYDIDVSLYHRNLHISHGLAMAFVVFEGAGRDDGISRESWNRKMKGMPCAKLVQGVIREVWGNMDVEDLYWKTV